MTPLSRRSFIAFSGVAAAGTTLVPSPLHPDVEAEAAPTAATVTKVPSVCEMCTSRCPMVAHVTDGKVTLITGNPDFPGTGGTVCARGGAGLSLTYDDQRVTKPLIRDGERGSGKWREVSYEEAIAYIADKMAKIKAEAGPEALAFAARAGMHNDHFFLLFNALGSPNTFTHDTTCPAAKGVAFDHTFGATLNVDYGNVKYLLSLGRNYLEGLHVPQVRGVLSAIDKGAKLVYVDPRYGLTAAKANEWLAIKPGTDLALVQAICHVLIRDNLYDKAFVDKYTVGFAEFAASVAQATPEWAAQETDIPAATIERIAKELAAAKPKAVIDPGWRTTYAHDEFSLRRAIILADVLLGAVEVPGGLTFGKTAGFVNGLVGTPVIPALAKPKTPPLAPYAKPRLDGAGVPGHKYEFGNAFDGIVQEIPEAILTGQPYPVKGWFVYRYNPALTMNNTPRVIEALKKLDLLVVCDIAVTDTAHFADVVLPEASFLERDEGLMDSSGSAPAYKIRQKAIEPLLPDYKPNWQIAKDLADKLGLSAYFPWKDLDEYNSIRTGGNTELLKTLKEKGVAFFGMKPLYLRDKASVQTFVTAYPAAAAKVDADGELSGPLLNLKTPSKKIEFVASKTAALGYGVPKYETPEFKPKDGELYFVQGKSNIHTNGHTHNVPMLHDLMPTNSLWLHPETAKKLGVANGDTVKVKTSTGETIGKALVTEGIRKDTVFTYFGFGRISPALKRAYNQGLNSNMVLPTVNSPVLGMTLHTCPVTVTKA